MNVESDVFGRLFHKFDNSNVNSIEKVQSTRQAVINQVILTQLVSIGKHFDCIEKANVCKKSVDGSKIKNKSKISQASSSGRHNVDALSEKKSQLDQSVPPLTELRKDRLIQKKFDERLRNCLILHKVRIKRSYPRGVGPWTFL